MSLKRAQVSLVLISLSFTYLIRRFCHFLWLYYANDTQELVFSSASLMDDKLLTTRNDCLTLFLWSRGEGCNVSQTFRAIFFLRFLFLLPPFPPPLMSQRKVLAFTFVFILRQLLSFHLLGFDVTFHCSVFYDFGWFSTIQLFPLSIFEDFGWIFCCSFILQHSAIPAFRVAL